MKKTLLILTGVVLGLFLALLFLIITINSKGFQKKMLNKYVPYEISFSSIKINPFKGAEISSLSISDSQINIVELNAKVKFRPFKLLAKKVDSIQLSINDIFLDLPSGEKEDMSTAEALELPVIDIPEITVDKIDLKVNSVIIENVAGMEGIFLRGGVLASKPDLVFEVKDFDAAHLPLTGSLDIQITGDLQDETDISVRSSIIYETYVMEIDNFHLKGNIQDYTLKMLADFSLKDHGKLSFRGINADLHEKGLNFSSHEISLSVKPLKIKEFQLNKLFFDAKDLKGSFAFDGGLEMTKGELFCDLEAAYRKDDIVLEKVLFTLSGRMVKKDLFIEINSTGSGKFQKEFFEAGILIPGKIFGPGTKNQYDLDPEIKMGFRGIQAQLGGRIKGDINGVNASLELLADISEKLDDLDVDSSLSLNLDASIRQWKEATGSLNAEIEVKQIQSPKIFLRDNLFMLASEFRGDMKSISTDINLSVDNILSAGLRVGYAFDSGAAKGNALINIDTGRIPLKDLGIDDLDIASGILTLNIHELELALNDGIFTTNGSIDTRDLVLDGDAVKDIPVSILQKNSILFSFGGDLGKELILGELKVNSEKEMISAEASLSYSRERINVHGNLGLHSPNRFRPAYANYLVRGGLNIPFDLDLYPLENNRFTCKGELRADHFYLTSSDIRINSLNGVLPLKYDSAIAGSLKLPEPLEKPLETLSSIKRMESNLVISRIYIMDYYLEDIKMRVGFDNYLHLSDMYFRFLGGDGIITLTATQGMEFWLKMNFTNGYAYNLLKNAPKDFSKEDSLVNIHANIFDDIDDLNGYLKMPGLGRSVLLTVIQAIDPEEKDPQIESLKNKVKLLGYYPETIELKLDGSTASIYVPLKKRGFNPINLPFSIQNIPIKKLLNSMLKKSQK